MQFQFLCPNGHLLAADVSQAGAQCRCPECGILFLIPRAATIPLDSAPLGPNPPIRETEPDASDLTSEPQIGPPEVVEPAEAPPINVEPDASDAPPIADSDEPAPPLHIPCPSGHELETPVEMLGEEALCPYCKARFQLRYEDSREYHEKRAFLRKLHEQKVSRLWLTWSIVAAVVVLGGLLMMIIASTL